MCIEQTNIQQVICQIVRNSIKSKSILVVSDDVTACNSLVEYFAKSENKINTKFVKSTVKETNNEHIYF